MVAHSQQAGFPKLYRLEGSKLLWAQLGLVAFALLIAGPLLYYAVVTTIAATNSVAGILPFTLAFIVLGYLVHL